MASFFDFIVEKIEELQGAMDNLMNKLPSSMQPTVEILKSPLELPIDYTFPFEVRVLTGIFGIIILLTVIVAFFRTLALFFPGETRLSKWEYEKSLKLYEKRKRKKEIKAFKLYTSKKLKPEELAKKQAEEANAPKLSEISEDSALVETTAAADTSKSSKKDKKKLKEEKDKMCFKKKTKETAKDNIAANSSETEATKPLSKKEQQKALKLAAIKAKEEKKQQEAEAKRAAEDAKKQAKNKSNAPAPAIAPAVVPLKKADPMNAFVPAGKRSKRGEFEELEDVVHTEKLVTESTQSIIEKGINVSPESLEEEKPLEDEASITLKESVPIEKSQASAVMPKKETVKNDEAKPEVSVNSPEKHEEKPKVAAITPAVKPNIKNIPESDEDDMGSFLSGEKEEEKLSEISNLESEKVAPSPVVALGNDELDFSEEDLASAEQERLKREAEKEAEAKKQKERDEEQQKLREKAAKEAEIVKQKRAEEWEKTKKAEAAESAKEEAAAIKAAKKAEAAEAKEKNEASKPVVLKNPVKEKPSAKTTNTEKQSKAPKAEKAVKEAIKPAGNPNGEYKIVESNGSYRFILQDNGGNAVFTSREYKNLTTCLNGTQTFKKNVGSGEFNKETDKFGNWKFVLVSKSNSLVKYDGELYKSEKECDKNIDAVKKYAGIATVIFNQ